MGEQWLTSSGIPLRSHYRRHDVPEAAQAAADTAPGQPPFLRGSYPDMYRTQPWRIFQLSGFGNPQDEGERIRFLLGRGSTGFIMEHDRNTADHLYDVDHPDVVARREDVGLTGAVILGVRDYETVLEGIDLATVYAHPGGGVVQHGPFALASYWTAARRRGIPLAQLSGTGQSDFFLTYVGCIAKQQVPARTGLRFNSDIIEFCAEHMPRWVPVSIAGYNGADSGLNGPQELGAVLANAVEYLDMCVERGRFDIDALARQVGGVSFRTSMDLFEDIAKLRAARKMWHDLLTTRYGVTDPRALRLRIHSLTAGSAMTYQQPINNLIRGTVMAFAGAFGGTQSLGVSGYDEAVSIPSEHAHHMSLRIQQILQAETNIRAVADPFGGSYFMETLTAQVEQQAWTFFEQIEGVGGFVEAVDTGWLHQHAESNNAREAERIASGDKQVVGVNCYTDDHEEWPVEGFAGTTDAFDQAMARLAAIRDERPQRPYAAAMRELEATCRGTKNIMPAIMDAVDADATLGDIGNVFRDVFGDWDVPFKF